MIFMGVAAVAVRMAGAAAVVAATIDRSILETLHRRAH
jgi:predicted nicotinamide N-methyase